MDLFTKSLSPNNTPGSAAAISPPPQVNVRWLAKGQAVEAWGGAGRIALVLLLYVVNVIFCRDVFGTLLTIPTMMLVLVGLLRIKSDRFELADMFWFCCFLFFVISPMQRIVDLQLAAPWEHPLVSYSAHHFYISEAIVFLCLAPMTLVRMDRLGRHSTLNLPFSLASMAVLASICCLLFVVFEGGIGRVLSSRTQQLEGGGFIGSFLFLGFQSVATALATLKWKERASAASTILLVALIVELMLVRNPFNSPRFLLLAAWLPIVFAFCHRGISAFWVYLTSLFGIIVVFPILSVTTRFGLAGLDDIRKIEFDKFILNIPFIDIFDTLVHCVRYMEGAAFHFGQKTLAIVAFFIPRAVWAGKPIVGGLDVGYDIYYIAHKGGTFNLSFFYGGDFYMDAGLIGVFLGGVAVALLFRYATIAKWGQVDGYPLLSVILMANVPIILRGPVGAILAFITCQVFALFVLSCWRSSRRGGLFALATSRAVVNA